MSEESDVFIVMAVSNYVFLITYVFLWKMKKQHNLTNNSIPGILREATNANLKKTMDCQICCFI